MAGTTGSAQFFFSSCRARQPPFPSGSRLWGCHWLVAAPLLTGGQHGQHNHSAHCRRNTFGSRRRLVRTRRLELGGAVFNRPQFPRVVPVKENGPQQVLRAKVQEFDVQELYTDVGCTDF